MVVTANTGKIIIPTTQQVIADYSKATGYDPNAKPDRNGQNPTDQGTDPTEMSKWVRENTCFGDKVLATAHVDPRNLNHQKWAGILLGPMILAYNLPFDAETQFNAGLPWTVSFMSRFRRGLGGHAVTWETHGKKGVKTMSQRGRGTIRTSWRSKSGSWRTGRATPAKVRTVRPWNNLWQTWQWWGNDFMTPITEMTDAEWEAYLMGRIFADSSGGTVATCLYRPLCDEGRKYVHFPQCWQPRPKRKKRKTQGNQRG
jgi:hypothetical protein